MDCGVMKANNLLFTDCKIDGYSNFLRPCQNQHRLFDVDDWWWWLYLIYNSESPQPHLKSPHHDGALKQ